MKYGYRLSSEYLGSTQPYETCGMCSALDAHAIGSHTPEQPPPTIAAAVGCAWSSDCVSSTPFATEHCVSFHASRTRWRGRMLASAFSRSIASSVAGSAWIPPVHPPDMGKKPSSVMLRRSDDSSGHTVTSPTDGQLVQVPPLSNVPAWHDDARAKTASPPRQRSRFRGMVMLVSRPAHQTAHRSPRRGMLGA